MLKIFDYIDEILATEQIRQAVHRANLRYYASDLAQHLGEHDPHFRAEAVRRAMEVCHAAGMSLDKNFKRIYLYSDNVLESDWLLSSLACYLFLMNGNPANPLVAKAQLIAWNNSPNK